MTEKLINKKYAFTLAEVLITLGIIGIVSAMTIPTLVKNYQEKTWNTTADIFEKKLETALKTMNTQQTLTGHATTESFVEELAKHFKINKVCKSDELSSCIENEINWQIIDVSKGSETEKLKIVNLKTAKDLGQKDWNTEVIGVQFANGTNAILAYNDNDCKQDPYSNLITGQDCISIIYDTSGFKTPNTTNKDVRSINSKIVKCLIKSNSSCFKEPVKSIAVSKTECEKMKQTHGIQKCAINNDFWAGAVKQCGGVDKLPTSKQLADIANYIYGTSNITDNSNNTNLSRDDAKTASLGFKFSSNVTFFVWTKDATSSYLANNRHFGPNSTAFYSDTRGENNRYVMCID